jgi:hypothetical protein
MRVPVGLIRREGVWVRAEKMVLYLSGLIPSYIVVSERQSGNATVLFFVPRSLSGRNTPSERDVPALARPCSPDALPGAKVRPDCGTGRAGFGGGRAKECFGPAGGGRRTKKNKVRMWPATGQG